MFEPRKFVKDESFDPIYKSVNKKFLFQSRIFPILPIFFGLAILVTQVLVPLVFFKTSDSYSKPIATTALGLATGFGEFNFDELDESRESTPSVSAPEFFYLTVPKLGIEDALVHTNFPSLDPEDRLGHYIGSNLPGEVGNTFIYGHSVLPFFYNPRNYKTIFSSLHSLEIGDKLYITYNNTQLQYSVESKLILKPEEVHPLADLKPDFLNESTVTLMTCYPPGTKMKRLLVNGTLVK